MTVLCQVCDGPDANDVFAGHPMHTDCAPGPWRKDREESEEFLARARAHKTKGDNR